MMTKFLKVQDRFRRPGLDQARVPKRLIGVNPGSVFVFHIPMHCLGEHFLLSLL